MLTIEEARARVNRGAELMDRYHPGWFRTIDIGRLDIAHGAHCIFGQVVGGYIHAVDSGRYRELPDATARVNYGFVTARGSVADRIEHELTQEAWVAAIRQRLGDQDAPVVVWTHRDHVEAHS